MWWQNAVNKLKGIGPKKAALLKSLQIDTIGDLLSYYPRPDAYIDLTHIRTLDKLQAEAGPQLCQGTVFGLRKGRSRRIDYLAATIKDATGYACLYFFGAARFQAAKLQRGDRLLVLGRAKRGSNMMLIAPEQWQLLGEDEAAVPGIEPVYPLTAGLSQRELRRWLKEALALACENLPETLPKELLQELSLLARAEALRNIHFPQNFSLLAAAKKRLAFEEAFLLQWGLAKHRAKASEGQPVAHRAAPRFVPCLLKSFPFQLTPGQRKAWEEIVADMEAERPMRRILQGDVGSGKTAVSALALAKAVENGYQGCLMAPTEILARQHYATLQSYFEPLGVETGLLLGGLRPKERQELLSRLKAGSLSILVGTHALLEDDVRFKRLSLVVCDEQHRFGVEQRAKLLAKADHLPDVLITTATPIPRTLALTLYGDLDISLMRGLPPGRKGVTTLCYPVSKRPDVYAGLVRQLRQGRQAYVVCPLIEEGENEVRSAQEVYRELKENYLGDLPSALLHGRLPAAEKEAVMAAFVKGDVKVLVSTTVIEVGVNVPNATLMIIENAEHFGLAQLHQLRGRVGRGSEQSFCALITGSEDAAALQRLGVLKSTADGFALAEQDLKMRGAGQFFGQKQHGLPDLRLLNLASDGELIASAREAVKKYESSLKETDLFALALDSHWASSFASIFKT